MIPPGGYFCSTGLTNQQGNLVTIRGASQATTSLSFLNDTGSGTYAIKGVTISDITINGPNHSSPADSNGTVNNLGYSPSDMNGVYLGSHSLLEHVSIGGFHSGVRIDSNHHFVLNCTIGNCYYGI